MVAGEDLLDCVSGGEESTASRPRAREVDDWFVSRLLPVEPALIRIAQRITGDEHAAREIVHEVYADLLKGQRWRTVTKPQAYASIAVRRAALRLASRAVAVPFNNFADMDLFAANGHELDAHQLLFAKQQRRIVLKAIDALPPRCREVVKMRRLEERCSQDIADHLGITVSVVDKHLARGMALIAGCLAAFHVEGA